MKYLPVVAIDGPVGVGKSTVAKLVAKKLNYYYLDTGAMYRAFALKCKKCGIDYENLKELKKIFENTTIDLKYNGDEILVLLDNEDVSEAIRTPEISMLTSKIANIKEVRDFLIKQQRIIGKKRPSVVEGRDIGTVVFPDAFVKIYLDADLKERVRRRYLDYKNKGIEISIKELEEMIKKRDLEDKNRPFGALKKAEDAIYLDSTNMNIEQVVEEIIKICKKRQHVISQ